MTHDPHHVPAEYKGRSRSFVKRMEAAGAARDDLWRAFNRAARMRATQEKTPRKEAVEGLLHALRQPTDCGLDLTCQRLGRRGEIVVQDSYMSAGLYRAGAWGKDSPAEYSLCLNTVSMASGKGRFRSLTEVRALISLHALGRWFQRAFGPGEDKLRADLLRMCMLAGALRRRPEEQQEEAEFAIYCESGGGWRIQWVPCPRDNTWVATARTYFTPDERGESKLTEVTWAA